MQATQGSPWGTRPGRERKEERKEQAQCLHRKYVTGAHTIEKEDMGFQQHSERTFSKSTC